MLTEQRFDIILKLLEERKSITVTELRELLDASESTVRRDITALDKAGKLTKVFGGAVALNHKVTAYEPTVAQNSIYFLFLKDFHYLIQNIPLILQHGKIMHPFSNMQVPNMPKLHPTSLQSKYHSCLLCLPAAFDPLFISLSEYFCCPDTPSESLL